MVFIESVFVEDNPKAMSDHSVCVQLSLPLLGYNANNAVVYLPFLSFLNRHVRGFRIVCALIEK